MSDFLIIMTAPFAACFFLTGVHAWLGLHVLARGVIFVDLALAQLAALGATVGFMVGFPFHTTGNWLISLSFALWGAALFAFSRTREPRVPQEAIIGIVYAVAGAGAILVLSHLPEGGEELKALLVGHLLFTSWHEVGSLALLYTAIGVVHTLFRRQLLLISEDPEAAFARGMRVQLWDLLFYSTFAVVVTSSVELAGVLLVFSFLVVPATCARLMTARPGLGLTWGISLVSTILGLLLSWTLDLPTGAAVVCIFGLTTAMCAAWSARRVAA